MKKGFLLASLLLPMMLNTACSSSSATNAGCDFVRGTAESHSDRREHDSSPGATTSDSHDGDILVGIFTALIGLVVRPFSDDGDECI